MTNVHVWILLQMERIDGELREVWAELPMEAKQVYGDQYISAHKRLIEVEHTYMYIHTTYIQCSIILAYEFRKVVTSHRERQF